MNYLILNPLEPAFFCQQHPNFAVRWWSSAGRTTAGYWNSIWWREMCWPCSNGCSSLVVHDSSQSNRNSTWSGIVHSLSLRCPTSTLFHPMINVRSWSHSPLLSFLLPCPRSPWWISSFAFISVSILVSVSVLPIFPAHNNRLFFLFACSLTFVAWPPRKCGSCSLREETR